MFLYKTTLNLSSLNKKDIGKNSEVKNHMTSRTSIKDFWLRNVKVQIFIEGDEAKASVWYLTRSDRAQTVGENFITKEIKNPGLER